LHRYLAPVAADLLLAIAHNYSAQSPSHRALTLLGSGYFPYDLVSRRNPPIGTGDYDQDIALHAELLTTLDTRSGSVSLTFFAAPYRMRWRSILTMTGQFSLSVSSERD